MKSRFTGLLLVFLVAPLAKPAPEPEPKIAAALRDGNRADAVLLIRKGTESVDAKLPDGATALHWAVRSDDPEMVSLLLDRKADANAADPDGVTPLAMALYRGHTSLSRETALDSGRRW
jgi:uncharacterized protein